MSTTDDTKTGDDADQTKTQPEKPAAKEPVKTDDKGDDKAEAEKLVAAEKAKQEKLVAKAVEKARAEALAEFKAQAEKDAKEAAELATKTETERAAAANKKLQEKLDAALAESAANKLAADLALELIDQSLQPASPKAREHIVSSFKAHVAAGKTPDEALKAVHAEEAYLFKAGSPVVEQPKVAPKTQPASKGPTSTPADQNAGPGDKLPANMTAAELREHVRTRFGQTIN